MGVSSACPSHCGVLPPVFRVSEKACLQLLSLCSMHSLVP